MDAFLGIVLLTITLLIVYGPLQSALTAYARQIVFECRDALFDLAASGEIDFNSDTYREIRSSMERLIRFAHLLTFERFMFFWWFAASDKSVKGMDDLVSQIDNEATQAKIKSLVKEAQLAVIKMLFWKSPLLWLLVLILVPFVVVATIMAKAWTVAFLNRAKNITSRQIEKEAANEPVRAAYA